MKAIALIPARLGATRFPEKLLATIKGKTVIRRTYESTVATNLFDEVIVVTDSERIKDEIEKHGGKAVMSQGEYESGTDRIAEVAEAFDADVFLNVQGDTPFVQRQPLAELLQVFEGEKGREVQVASMVQELNEPELIADPNYVKVVMDFNSDALYFSRCPIPYLRNNDVTVTYYEHIGVYAFRQAALASFPKMAQTPLELAEKVECLRYLENGIKMRMTITQNMGVEIDTPEDIARAEAFMEKMGLE
jgi:3-deoxy-D-manno-octulosonate cytidylyltransferase